MDIDLLAYRPSFNIAILSTDASLSHRFLSVLATESYTVKSFESLQDLEAGGRSFPPHILLLDYRLLDDEYESLIRVNKKFPETFCYFLGVVDDLDPIVENLQNFKGLIPQGKLTSRVLTSIMDDAIQTLLLKYEVEKLSDRTDGLSKSESNQIIDVMDSTGKDHNEALERFSDWVQRLSLIQHYDEAIKLFANEILNYFDFSAVIYFKYLPAYASLVATHSEGLAFEKIRGMGLNFSEDQSFKPMQDLARLAEHKAFSEMIQRASGKSDMAVSLLTLDQVIKGMFVFVGGSASQLEDPYFTSCLSVLRRWLSEVLWREKVYSLERHDELTGCLNKKTFTDHVFLEVSRSRRIKLPVSYVYVGIDQIQKIKGELNTDRYKTLLKMVAKVLDQSIRKTDFVGRMSESEFAVLFPHMNMENLKVKARRLKRLLESARYFNDLQRDFEVTITLCISEYPSTAYDAEDLMLSVSQKYISEENSSQVLAVTKSEGFVPDFEPS